MNVSEKSKIFYLVIVILFLIGAGLFWLDYLGLVDINRFYQNRFAQEEESVLYADGDEPSLVKLEEFQKEHERLEEREANLDRREAGLLELQKELEREKEQIAEMREGLDLERKKFEDEKERHTGYRQNVMDLAIKIFNMPPDDSVEIMVQWEDPLIIDVLRQIDDNAAAEGRMSMTPFLISQMPRDKAGRIMYLMTQL